MPTAPTYANWRDKSISNCSSLSPSTLILMVVLIESVLLALSGLAARGSGIIGIGPAIACSAPSGHSKPSSDSPPPKLDNYSKPSSQPQCDEK
jgi:hypothetical protein